MTSPMTDNILIDVKNLKTHFFLEEGTVQAVNGIDFQIKRGRTLGIVGESGCGKSVTARSLLRIVPNPGQIVEGQILFHRQRKSGNGSSASTEVIDLVNLDKNSSEIRGIRGGEISMIFQEPMTSLSPIHTIGNQIVEAIRLHRPHMSKSEMRRLAIEMLESVGMPQPNRTIDRFSYELSGGMRQRAMIAMALSCHPSLLIADEPTTALDVTTQAQILVLMRHLQEELGMAIMFITHDLGVVAQMCDDVVVMYMGRVVERADIDTIFHNPKHPYTQALLESIPRLGQRTREHRRLASIRGSVPDPYAQLQGCTFHPRCRQAIPGVCDKEDPPIIDLGNGQEVECHLYA